MVHEVLRELFFEKSSTEAMIRGSTNEGPVLSILKTMQFIVNVFDVVILSMSVHPHLPCSPDAVALLNFKEALSFFLQGMVIFSSMSRTFGSLQLKSNLRFH